MYTDYESVWNEKRDDYPVPRCEKIFPVANSESQSSLKANQEGRGQLSPPVTVQ